MKKVVLFLLLLFISGLITFIIYNIRIQKLEKLVERDIIYEGIYIDGIDMGGLSLDRAELILQKRDTEHFAANHLIVKGPGGTVYELKYNELNFRTDYKEIVVQAYGIAKEGKLKERSNLINKIKENNILLVTKEVYQEDLVQKFVESIAKDYDKQPVNAILIRDGNQFVITPEINGSNLNITNSVNQINLALKNHLEDVDLSVETIVPEITYETYEVVTSVLGSFSTEFNPNQVGRCDNIRLAAGKINGTILMPGDEFSTNETLGPIDVASGYKEAPIIVGGELEPGIGGGVCQVAGTLYNAVLLSELEVVKRRNHSIPVAYLEKGRDATLSGNIIDLMFANNTENPIYIECLVQGDQLIMNIYGKEYRPIERRIDFQTEIVETIEAPEAEIIIDGTLLPGEEVVEKKSSIGYTVKLYKLIYMNNVLTDKILMNTSTYAATAAVIRVGPVK